MSMSTISLSLIVFCVVTIVVGIYEIHSLPGEIAKKRGHPQTEAITVCSVMGLLIFPLWMFALVWAYAGVLGQPLPAEAPAGALAAEPEPEPEPEPEQSPDASREEV
jgi:hypothetical protein